MRGGQPGHPCEGGSVARSRARVPVAACLPCPAACPAAVPPACLPCSVIDDIKESVRVAGIALARWGPLWPCLQHPLLRHLPAGTAQGVPSQHVPWTERREVAGRISAGERRSTGRCATRCPPAAALPGGCCRSVRGLTLRLADKELTPPSQGRQAVGIALPLLLEKGGRGQGRAWQRVHLPHSPTQIASPPAHVPPQLPFLQLYMRPEQCAPPVLASSQIAALLAETRCLPVCPRAPGPASQACPLLWPRCGCCPWTQSASWRRRLARSCCARTWRCWCRPCLRASGAAGGGSLPCCAPVPGEMRAGPSCRGRPPCGQVPHALGAPGLAGDWSALLMPLCTTAQLLA